MQKILIVEDDRELSGLLCEYLQRAQLNTTPCYDGNSALGMIRDITPDAVVLDITLPGLDGLSICREARKFYTGPILMLTALPHITDEIVGLELGADDYIHKPVEPRLFLARIRAALRRGEQRASTVNTLMRIQSVEIDPVSRKVSVDGQNVALTMPEYELLVVLAQHAGKILSRDFLYNALFNHPHDGLNRTVDIRISTLRQKLQDDPQEQRLIKTIRNKGYMLCLSA